VGGAIWNDGMSVDVAAIHGQQRLMLTLDAMDFLGDWLLEHLQGSDAQYAPFLNREGASWHLTPSC